MFRMNDDVIKAYDAMQSSVFVSLCISKTTSRIPHCFHITPANCLIYLAPCSSAVLYNRSQWAHTCPLTKMTSAEPPEAETDQTTRLPSLGIVFVDLLGGFQYKSSERSGSFSNMPVLPEQLEHTLQLNIPNIVRVC